MVDPTQVFDLWDVLVNELVGDVGLFIIVGLALIIFLSVKFNVPFGAGFIFSLLFLMVVVIATAESFPIVWVLVVAVVGLISYLGLAKLFRR